MSHELRTPLNSLLILAKLLSDNKEQNLSDKQVEYAQDDLRLGRRPARRSSTRSSTCPRSRPARCRSSRATSRSRDVHGLRRAHLPAGRRAEGAAVRRSSVGADAARARSAPTRSGCSRCSKNLLSNAFKFTEQGRVDAARAAGAEPGTRFEQRDAATGRAACIAFSVIDTGIGIAEDKQKLIFEAFQQADGTTSRKYGGTGLGLSIRREIARLLGGEIHVESEPGEGSTFTLYLPERYVGPSRRGRRARRTQPTPWRACAPVTPSASARATLGSLLDGRCSAPDAIVLRPIDDDREHIARRRSRAADHRGRPEVRAHHAAAWRARRASRRSSRPAATPACAGERAPARRDHARHPAAGARRLDGARPPQAQPAHPPHPGARHLRRRPTSQRRRALGAFAYLEKPVSKEALEGAFTHISSFLDRKVKQLLARRGRRRPAQSITELVGDGDDVEVTAVAHRRGGARDARGRRVRLHGARPGAAGRGRHPAARGGARRSRGSATCRSSSTPARTSPTKEEARLKKYAESIILKSGVQLAGAAAQRHGAVPPPGGGEACPTRAKAAAARASAGRNAVAGQEGAGRRRRRAQHLRHDQRAREPRHRGASTPRTGSDGIEALRAEPGHRPRADGRDDAGDGRLRDDARASAQDPVRRRCRSSPSPPRR